MIYSVKYLSSNGSYGQASVGILTPDKVHFKSKLVWRDKQTALHISKGNNFDKL